MAKQAYEFDPNTPDGHTQPQHPELSKTRIFLPCRHKGTGFTLLSDRSDAIFASALTHCLPELLDRVDNTIEKKGFCTLLAPVLGVDSFHDFSDSTKGSHWSHFFSSGSQIAAEFKATLVSVKDSLGQLIHQLPENIDLCQSLAVDVESIKPLSTGTKPPSLQRTITQERYKLIATLLEKQVLELDLHDPRRRSFLNYDKFSSQLFSSLPNNQLIPPSRVFREAAANQLGLPSPMCRHFVGARIRNSANCHQMNLDPHGFSLTRVTGVHGSSRTPLHNEIQRTLAREARACGLRVQETPSNVLTVALTNEQAEAIANGAAPDVQTRVIPDLAIQSNDVTPRKYYDIKTLASGPFYDEHFRADKEPYSQIVNFRAKQVAKEYETATRRHDRAINPDLPANEKGPMQAALAAIGGVQGLAFGGYAEASKSVHQLVGEIAEEQAEAMMDALGCQTAKQAQRVLKELLRRKLGIRVALGWAELKIRVFDEAVSPHARQLMGIAEEAEDELIVQRNQRLNWVGPQRHR